MIAATDAEYYIFADPYHTGRMRLIGDYSYLAMLSIEAGCK